MGMPGLSFPLACTQFSPAHLISSIIHYLFTKELSGHPIHPQEFSCASIVGFEHLYGCYSFPWEIIAQSDSSH